MNLIVNGRPLSLSTESSERTSLQDLIDHLGLTDKLVIAEVDKQIVDRGLYSQYILQEDMNIELVHFVGGG